MEKVITKEMKFDLELKNLIKKYKLFSYKTKFVSAEIDIPIIRVEFESNMVTYEPEKHLSKTVTIKKLGKLKVKEK